jgi:hypothetical protein
LHRAALAVDGVGGLIQDRAHRGHLRGGAHRIPPGFLVLDPAADPLAVRCAPRGGDVRSTVAESGAARPAPQAFPWAPPGQQRVEWRTPPLATRGRHAAQRGGELVKRGAQAVAQARPRTQGPQTADGAVEAIGQGAPPLIRGLLGQGSALQRAIGRRTGRGAFGRPGPQRPEPAATHDGGQLHLLSQAPAVLGIRQEITRQRHTTPGQHRAQAVVSQGADHPREGHG